MISGFLLVPTKEQIEEQIECQHPKPILLDTGNAKLPYLWDPASVPISVYQVGQLFILSVPGKLNRKTLLGGSENAFFHIPDWLLSNSVGLG